MGGFVFVDVKKFTCSIIYHLKCPLIVLSFLLHVLNINESSDSSHLILELRL